MNFPQHSSDNLSLTARFTRLIAALLEHFLALFSLASWEAKQGFKQILLCFLFLFFALVFGFIGYLLFLTLFVIVATFSWHFSWLVTLSLLALSHFFITGIFLYLLYHKRPTSFLKLTHDELLRDIENLNHH